MEHEKCLACQFDGTELAGSSVLGALRGLGPRWAALLNDAGDELRVRPTPVTWSAIEYAAHSRDITALHRWAVDEALTGSELVLPAIAADGLIDSASDDYRGTDPTAVTDALQSAAVAMADAAGTAGEATWDRGMTIGDSRSSVRRLLEHALHDSSHHLVDVSNGLAALRSHTG